MKVKLVHFSKDLCSNIDKYGLDSAVALAGREAGICYMSDSYLSDKVYDTEAAIKRAEGILKTGHHSPFDHISMGLEISDIPKILAMLLNSTRFYTTSEKSARYTKMSGISHKEKVLYDKWVETFKNLIAEKYPNIDEKRCTKLAMENARYVISVFTPTSMGFTTTFRQLSYLYYWLKDFAEVSDFSDSEFLKELSKYCNELADLIYPYTKGIVPNIKGTHLKFLPTVFTKESDFDRCHLQYAMTTLHTYDISYVCSLACIAQLHRHRTLNYSISEPLIGRFYLPPILTANGCKELIKEWFADLESIKDLVPQATLVYAVESGLVEDFTLKCKERLCGRAQLEAAQNVYNSAKRIYASMKVTCNGLGTEIPECLKDITNGDYVNTKCQIRGIKCTEPCEFGKNALTRLI